jgi:hypothetical protein
MFHVTNGDATVDLLRAAGVNGEILPWRDVLHEGPVPAGLSPSELRRVRARFIAGEGWGDEGDVLRDFERRDAALARYPEHDEVVLWFEHDLYDQLQILQVLDFFAEREPDALTMISFDRHVQDPRFHGLGQLRPEDVPALFDGRRPVTRQQTELARSAWRAFRAPEPTAIVRFLERDSSALPYLAAALRRHLEQLPSAGNGLGRTERQAIEAVAAGRRRFAEVFMADQEREERPFMGDATFRHYLERLASGERPLLDLADDTVTLTGDGRRVLAGNEDQVRLNGVDRWLGGVHLSGRTAWRWDAESGLVPPEIC